MLTRQSCLVTVLLAGFLATSATSGVSPATTGALGQTQAPAAGLGIGDTYYPRG